ncbi:MAG: hypothetical protein ONB06_02955 [candidate division KSB1 bacterium]|nr:hypothetical protein [candidate division KSB1 bacterium]
MRGIAPIGRMRPHRLLRHSLLRKDPGPHCPVMAMALGIGEAQLPYPSDDSYLSVYEVIRESP